MHTSISLQQLNHTCIRYVNCRVCAAAGGHINPAVTFGLFVGRKLSLVRTVLYIVAQCLGAICGAGMVKGIAGASYETLGGGANSVADGVSVGAGLGAEIAGTFVLVYTVLSATDPKRTARDSFIPVLVPLPIGFAVFIVHLATIPITGTGINPARSLGAAVMYNQHKAWKDHVSRHRTNLIILRVIVRSSLMHILALI
ncbi:unnamed protein product [Triticum turgidum subsp. durum]|uniref:Aquaporin n=1 Tax=Triticum turgidum subsp. durum TaxID=4567 RepID=A0A9R0XEH5_TRITD|nr:unnamed protein product [Triticum turgidum subsp. durum]